MPTDVVRRSRRAFLATAAGSAAALAAAQLAKPAAVLAVEEPVYRNTDNPTAAVTACRQGSTDQGGFEGIGNGHGWGIKGVSASGPGVLGTADLVTMAGVVGLQGDTTSSYYQDVLDNPDVEALASGVYGYSVTGDYPNGVFGDSPTDYGTGVFGEGGYGVLGFGYVGVVGVAGEGEGSGVHGHGGNYDWPDAPAGTGVFATCVVGGVALDARGKVKFDRANKVTIKKGTSKYKKTLAGVTTSSQVFAVLRTYRSGVYVAAVVPSTGYFTIYLNKVLGSDTTCSYFVVN